MEGGILELRSGRPATLVIIQFTDRKPNIHIPDRSQMYADEPSCRDLQ